MEHSATSPKLSSALRLSLLIAEIPTPKVLGKIDLDAINPEEQRKALGLVLANHLKKLYLTYNRDSVNDQLIINQLKEMSDGKITLPEDISLHTTNEILKNASNANANKPLVAKKKKKKKKKKNNIEQNNK